MKILVCLKDVPDPSARIEIAPDSLSFQIDSSAPYVMSSLDEQALEEALTIKDSNADARIHVLTIGTERSIRVLRRALGMGADHAILGSLPHPSLVDHPIVVASAIASWARAQTYSLYLLGAASDDLMQGQVGPMLAELMGWPCATCVVSIKTITEKTILVEREILSGLRCALEIDLPAVATILSSQRVPRYPSLTNMLRAKKTTLATFAFNYESSPDKKRTILSYHYPAKERNSIILQGDLVQQADQLIDVLKKKGLI